MLYAIDYLPFRVFDAQAVQEEDDCRWWVLLLTHAQCKSHTKIEKSKSLREVKSLCLANNVWRVAVIIELPNDHAATKFMEKFQNATIRGSVSRSVVFEQVAAILGFDVYTDLGAIFKFPGADLLLQRKAFRREPSKRKAVGSEQGAKRMRL